MEAPQSSADGFEELYRQSRERLTWQLFALTADWHASLDLVQEAFIRTWERWDQVVSYNNPESYVRRIALNVTTSRWRRLSRIVGAGPPELAAAMPDVDRHNDLVSALRLISAPEREAIVLHYLVGMSIEELAQEKRVPAGTVKSWLSRGRSRLAAHLGHRDVEGARRGLGGMVDNQDWLDNAFRQLTDRPVPHAWLSAEEVRRCVERRRRRRWISVTSGVVGAAIAFGLLGAFVIDPSGSGPTPELVRDIAGPDGSIHFVVSTRPTVSATPREMSRLSTSEQALALDLTRQELSESPQSNVVLSPMSADIDLSMLELAAAGSTEGEIAKALHSGNLTSEENAAAWMRSISLELAAESPNELALANSLWVQQHLDVTAGFLQRDSVDFGNDTYQVNFHTPSATKAINAWVAQETDGRITQLFATGELSPTTAIVLANALHFHAAWQKTHQFTVRNKPFVTAAGTTVSVPTLDGYRDQLKSTTTASYQAVQIPFSTGRFAALVIAPHRGTLNSWLASLTPGRLAAVVSALSMGNVYLTLPALSVSSRPLLNTALAAMGMKRAFLTADLTPLLGGTVGHRVRVAKVQQAVSLKVNSGGIDAAASTGSAVEFTSGVPGAVIDFDHPYLFLVRDTKTGLILFSAVVNNPSDS